MLCQRPFLTSKLIGGTWDLPGFSGATFLVLFTETPGNVPAQTRPGLQTFPSQGLCEQHPSQWPWYYSLGSNILHRWVRKTRPFGKYNRSRSNMKTSATECSISTWTLLSQKELVHIPQEKTLLGDLGLKNVSKFSKICNSILLPLRIQRVNVLVHQFIFPALLSSPLVTPSCPTLCDPMDCGPPGSSVHGILQAGILEWAAISSSIPA